MSKTPKIKKAAKTYRFVVSVAGANSKSAAFRAILVAFANRDKQNAEDLDHVNGFRVGVIGPIGHDAIINLRRRCGLDQ